MNTTAISWTDKTWNPVSGCSRVSDGCRFCYAEAIALRFGWSKKPWTAANAGPPLFPPRTGQRVAQVLQLRSLPPVLGRPLLDQVQPLLQPLPNRQPRARIELTKKTYPQLADKNLAAFTAPIKGDYARPEQFYLKDADSKKIWTDAVTATFTKNEQPVADAFKSAAQQVNQLNAS